MQIIKTLSAVVAMAVSTQAQSHERALAALNPLKCTKQQCMSINAPPKDDKTEKLIEDVIKLTAEAAVAAASTVQEIGIGVAAFKLFTGIYNAALVSGSGLETFDPFEALENRMVNRMSAANDLQDVTNQAKDIGHKLRDVATDLGDYEKYRQAGDLVQANKELELAREHCEDLHDLVVRGQYTLRAKLTHSVQYCSLCAYVLTISRGVRPDDSVVATKQREHVKACATTIPSFVEGAIAERMKTVDTKINIMLSGNSLVCHPFDWAGGWNYWALDGGQFIFNWKEMGICPVKPALLVFGVFGLTSKQVECFATDGLPGTIGHEGDRCLLRYRKFLVESMLESYRSLLTEVTGIWRSADAALNTSNDLAVNTIQHNRGLFGPGFQQYAELTINKYDAGYVDVKSKCYQKCLQEEKCTGFSYRIDDRYDGRTNGNCWFMTGEIKATSDALQAVPRYAGSWVKNAKLQSLLYYKLIAGFEYLNLMTDTRIKYGVN